MNEATQIEVKANARSVPRRHQLPYAEFERDYLRPNKPVILSGYMKDGVKVVNVIAAGPPR